ncbi:hydantoinase B/oxoprolinase family protein [Baekduia soli]|uniref:hydantoinase B/oxoprolinase family protein n=1 Tax=Baekduia soli TaxID=496014 RepID=UPI002AA2AED3|nr:hydantoinase B/oxoprolinase family protein [Baekduia soli]
MRHSLWNANEEHGSIIANLSVSPISLETRDFQTAIISAEGEILFFGPYLQYLAGFMDMVAKFIIERRGEDIRPGDMWLVNDPWIGTAHQPDVNLMCPVFQDGELFCWVANNVHQNDIGGTVPGSFCTNAQDIYYDPVVIPPVRIVKNDEIDVDIESFYRRQSRTPINLALDLRACIAGNHAARQRIYTLIERYGARTVKGVMNGILDASESAFTALLDTIPDGEWSERCYHEVAVTGDRGTYRIELHLKKQGRSITFTNEGTDPEVGAINLPFAALRGTTLAAINVLMLAEQMGVIGGAARQVSYEPVPGTLTCPNYGVAVSPAGIYSTELSMAMSNAVLSKMLLCSSDEAVRDKALSTTPAQWHIHIHAGVNQRGAYYVGPMLDAIIGTTGATRSADGTFANGVWWIPEGRGPNVETYERDWPILYLYRGEDQDSGGAGRFRGGNGGRLAYIPYKGEVAVGVYSAEGVPKTAGLFGGNPGSVGATTLLRGSDVVARLAAGELPGSAAEIEGTVEPVQNKGVALPVDHDAVLEWNWGGSAGYGDPLTRDPARVGADVAAGSVGVASASDTYGVIASEAGEVDAAATEARRAELRTARLRAAGSGDEAGPLDLELPAGAVVIGEDIWVNADDDAYCCAHCGRRTGALSGGHPKEELLVHQHAMEEIGPRFVDPAAFVDDPMVWREYFCPGCATRLATEVARPDDPPFVEIRLDR